MKLIIKEKKKGFFIIRKEMVMPVVVDSEGKPKGNDLAIMVYNDPEKYQDDYELVE